MINISPGYELLNLISIFYAVLSIIVFFTYLLIKYDQIIRINLDYFISRDLIHHYTRKKYQYNIKNMIYKYDCICLKVKFLTIIKF